MREWILTFLAFGHLPGLGSPDYQTREAAQAAIQDLGHAALPAILYGEASKDCEIRCRCVVAENAYYAQVHLSQVSIWYLPDELRFMDGEDLAKKYYSLARQKTDKIRDENPAANAASWIVSDYAWTATKLYILDQLKARECRDDMATLREQMTANFNTLHGDGGFLQSELDENNIPKSIAVRQGLVADKEVPIYP